MLVATLNLYLLLSLTEAQTLLCVKSNSALVWSHQFFFQMELNPLPLPDTPWALQGAAEVQPQQVEGALPG